MKPEARFPTSAEPHVTVRPEPDILAAIDRFIAAKMPGATREEALLAALREWAGRHGYLPVHQEGLRPEELNASNDD